MTESGYGIAFPGQGAKIAVTTAALHTHRNHWLVAQLLDRFGARNPEDLDLNETAVAQPTVYALGIAAVESAFGPEFTPPLVLGHSLGELTAAACAGILDKATAFDLAITRGALCRKANLARPGAMIAVVAGDLTEVEWLRRHSLAESGGILEIAGVNSRRQAVLSGDLATVERAVRLGEEQYVRIEPLPISGGFHSPLMLAALPEWRCALESVEFRPPQTRFVSTIDACAHTDPAEIRELLVRALILPVRWRDAVCAVRDLGIPGLIDTGPGDTLAKLGRRDHLVEFSHLDQPADLAAQPGPAPEAAPDPSTDRRALLTGATGFLGAFLLRELLDSTQADVWCLVRAKTEERGRQRIIESMERYLLWDEALGARIHPVLGDLAKPALGLTEPEWSRLSEEIDVIYHNGARVSHVAPYEHLREPNVVGTAEILRLADTHKTKAVHFVSTAAIPQSLTDTGAPDQDLSATLSGYVLSKWDAEQLVRQAADQGLPARIYRPGRVSGHSVTGSCQENDMVWNFVRAVVLLGQAPEVAVSAAGVPGSVVPEVSFAPIDYVTRALVRLSTVWPPTPSPGADKDPEPAALRYLINRSRMPLRDLIEYVSLRFPIKVVPADDWLSSVATGTDDHGRAMAAPRLLLPSFRRLLAGLNVPPVLDDQATLDDLAGTGISCPPIGHRLLTTYLDYFQKTGFLP